MSNTNQKNNKINNDINANLNANNINIDKNSNNNNNNEFKRQLSEEEECPFNEKSAAGMEYLKKKEEKDVQKESGQGDQTGRKYARRRAGPVQIRCA